jgi:hypothetical protein
MASAFSMAELSTAQFSMAELIAAVLIEEVLIEKLISAAGLIEEVLIGEAFLGACGGSSGRLRWQLGSHHGWHRPRVRPAGSWFPKQAVGFPFKSLNQKAATGRPRCSTGTSRRSHH